MTRILGANEAGWNIMNSYSRLPKLFFSPLTPNPVRNPKLILLNDSLSASLGLNAGALQTEDGIALFAGNAILENAIPLAQAYAGHQFGYFTMLGDGRAMLIAEQITPQNELFDIQLKGSGRTPYSRGGDGRAALGPMLREFIISEAMHGLGIPTTRSLAIVTTGESIIREKKLPGTILTRVAASHLRVGTFEYAANWGSLEELKALADYAIERHYPEVQDNENPYKAFLKKVVQHQASLISKWQLVGFIHGVMNTDNMTISGETIDYGPCAFMDVYDPATVFSSIDRHGRYAYGNQPSIGKWNLSRFAESLIPLLHNDQHKAINIAQQAIDKFTEMVQIYWLHGMRAKLGLFNEENEDEQLVTDLLQLMQTYRADYTNTFLSLTFNQTENSSLFKAKEFTQWKERWEIRRDRQESKNSSDQLMKNSNPAVIPRNHRVEEALEAAVEKGDYSVMHRLLQALSSPYQHSAEQVEYATLPPETSKCYKTYCGT